MADENLVTYIINQQKKGVDEHAIEEALQEAGWTEDQIAEGFHTAKGDQGTSSQQPEGHNQNAEQDSAHNYESFWRTLGGVIASPPDLFKAKRSSSLGNALMYTILCHLFPFIIGLILLIGTALIIMSLGSIAGDMSGDITALLGGASALIIVIGTIFLGVITLVVSPILQFVGAAILHVLTLLFGSHTSYAESYKAYVYAFTPMVVLMLIPFLNVIGIIWSYILLIPAVAIHHRMSYGKSAGVVALFALIGLVVMIGVSSLQVNTIPDSETLDGEFGFLAHQEVIKKTDSSDLSR